MIYSYHYMDHYMIICNSTFIKVPHNMSCGGQSVPLFTRDWNRLTMPGPQDPQEKDRRNPESRMSLMSLSMCSECEMLELTLGMYLPQTLCSLLCDCVFASLWFFGIDMCNSEDQSLISSDSQAMTDSTLQGSRRTTKIAIYIPSDDLT